jgi:glycosyltransferase involved in cell wall biosynthesis
MERVTICIPAFNPTKALLYLVDELVHHDLNDIIVVNDGSEKKAEPIFKKLEQYPTVGIIHLSQNGGKGSAVKAAIQMVLERNQKVDGIITCGADYQHHIDDILTIVKTIRLFDDGMIIGMRLPNRENRSFLYRAQVKATTLLFQMLFKRQLLDFQSGLRFYPYYMLSWIYHCAGNNYLFDTNVVIEAIQRNVPIYELPIGKMRITKSSFLHYDELSHPTILANHLVKTYLKNAKPFK